jgi:hypothetical protein
MSKNLVELMAEVLKPSPAVAHVVRLEVAPTKGISILTPNFTSPYIDLDLSVAT